MRISTVLAHASAAGLALLFAHAVSETDYVATGVQFVAPLAVVLLVHLVWIGLKQGFVAGYSAQAIQRSLVTSLAVVGVSLLAAMFAPMPAEAAGQGFEQVLGGLLMMLACLLVVALVFGTIGGILFLVYYGLASLWRLYRGPRDGEPPGPGTGVNDLGAVTMMFVVIAAASLEGVAGAYSFMQQDTAARSVEIAAPPSRVWQAVGRATSPEFPLPIFLKSVPQPVAVLLDEGAALGARRTVRFRGREGEGDLTLQVTRRSETEAVFTALSDTSPIAMWVRQKSITFRVEPAGSGTRLTVTSEFERLLAPAWFFRPYVRLASYLAVDVLARDTGARSLAR